MYHSIVGTFRRRLHALLVRNDGYTIPTTKRMQRTTFTMSNGWPTSTYVEKRPCEHAVTCVTRPKIVINEIHLANSSKSTSSEVFRSVRHCRELEGSKEREGWNVLGLRRAAFLE